MTTNLARLSEVRGGHASRVAVFQFRGRQVGTHRRVFRFEQFAQSYRPLRVSGQGGDDMLGEIAERFGRGLERRRQVGVVEEMQDRVRGNLRRGKSGRGGVNCARLS